MLHHRKFQLQGYSFFGCYIMVCTVCASTAFICLTNWREDSGNSKRSDMESSKNKFHLQLTKIVKRASVTRIIGSLLGFLLLFCQFREDCDYISEFRCSRKISARFFGIGPCTCKEICRFCSFNLPKVMKMC